jgi:hypothetical protein
LVFRQGLLFLPLGGRIAFGDPVMGGALKQLNPSATLFVFLVFALCKQVFIAPKTKKPHPFSTGKAFITFVGVAGFEPAASTSQMWRDTGLRYTPSGLQK